MRSRKAAAKGLLIQGDAEVFAGPDDVFSLTREAAKRPGTPEAELPTEVRSDMSCIRINPERFVSLDCARDR